MRSFDLIEMTRLVGMKFAKVKNWTVDRPFTIHPSAYQASGRGSMNLYSIQDVYLMAVAGEFSKAGFAAVAIGKLVKALQAKFPDLGAAPVLMAWRPKAGGEFEITEANDAPPDAALRVIVDAPRIVEGVNRRAEKLPSRKAKKR
jgi:hypothetical protein